MAAAALAGYKSGETSQVNVLNWKNWTRQKQREIDAGKKQGKKREHRKNTEQRLVPPALC
jgi:hypothetical protein